jgi:predicted secreted protein
VVLFAVLPFGVRVPDRIEPGLATSAPENPKIWLKFGVTTVVSGVLWLVVYWLIVSEVVTLRPD